MATTASKGKASLRDIADKWRQGTQHYQEAYRPVAQRIHEKAKDMPHDNMDDAAAIVEMAARETREFAEGYHRGE